MLNLPGHRGCNCEGPTRRELLRIGSIGMMGLSLPHFFLWREKASAAAVASKYAGARGWESAKNVVMIFLQGGPSHVDIWDPKPDAPANIRIGFRSEEHTSELQSHSDLVCRLLLEKKKKKK